jgi:hypothetical protein
LIRVFTQTVTATVLRIRIEIPRKKMKPVRVRIALGGRIFHAQELALVGFAVWTLIRNSKDLQIRFYH